MSDNGAAWTKANRKMNAQIGGREVYAREITNADLERKDEMEDELTEMRRAYGRLVGSDERSADGEVVHTRGLVDEEEDPDRRRELRSKARDLMKEIRRGDTLMLGIYVEDEDGEPFSDEALLSASFRVQALLSKKATSWAFGVDDEELRPTQAGSASG
jgi:hypothetical protein